MSTLTDDKFDFSILATPTSIRLFRLASHTGEELAFDVFDYELEDAPTYTALSYRWGSDELSHSFILNSKTKPIHENLWTFLDQLRTERDTRWYWTDGISINQENPSEKSRQVSIMADIYTKAQSVVIWLGPHPHIAHCLEVLEQFNRPEFLKGENETAKEMARTHAVLQILNLEYWKRAWIVQEVTLGKNIRLKSCAAEFDYETFFAFSGKSGMSPYGFNRSRTEASWALLKLIESYNSSKNPFNIAKWLSELEGLLCKDPRDRIYSLLGLLRYSHEYDKIQHPMTVDYSKSAEVVFLECAFMLLSSTQADSGRDNIKPIYDLITKSPARGLASLRDYSFDPSIPPGHKVWIDFLIKEVTSFQLAMAEVKDFFEFRAYIVQNDRLSVEKKIAHGIADLAVKRESLHDSKNPWPLPKITGTCSYCQKSTSFFFITDEELSTPQNTTTPNGPRDLVFQILRKAVNKTFPPGHMVTYSIMPEDDYITVSLTGGKPSSVVLWIKVKPEWIAGDHHRVPRKNAETDENGHQDVEFDRWWFVARQSDEEKAKWRVFPVLLPGTICSCSQIWVPDRTSTGPIQKARNLFARMKPGSNGAS